MRGETTEKNALDEGITLFNEGKYYEAHEAWEGEWLCAKDDGEKHYYQGLIMAAGAFLHYERRECAGAARLLEKSVPLLKECVGRHPHVRLAEFVRSLDGLTTEFNLCTFGVTDAALPRIARVYQSC